MRSNVAAHRCWACGASLLVFCLITGSVAAAEDPLSAIDWLAPPDPVLQQGSRFVAPDANAAPAASDATAPDVTVTPLSDASAAGVGLLPSAVSGLPVDLWSGSDAETLAEALDALPTLTALPEAQRLLFTLLLAEVAPPPGQADRFLAARLDALTQRGAIAPAREMAALLPPGQSAEIVARQAEIALLDGDTTAICTEILARASLALDPALPIFCAARAGAWDRAFTLLEAGKALGDLPTASYNRLARFLDPELAESLPDLPPPSASTLSALDYRLLVATGAPLPTATLPLRFAVAEVSGDSGWKPRIEAAERLVRAGAMDARQLFAAYRYRDPAASGGVWDRVAAFQNLEAALETGRSEQIDAALLTAWPLFQNHGLAVPLAHHLGPQLDGVALSDAAQDMANAAMLLSRDYERLAASWPEQDADVEFAVSLARGVPQDPPDVQARAIAAAWDDTLETPVTPERGRLGATLLETLTDLHAGSEGDLRALTRGLRQLRALGLEDSARRIALQLRLAAPLA